MVRFAQRATIAGAFASILALGASCGDEEDPAPNVAGERLTSSAWIISNVGDFDADGLDDVLWDDTAKSAMAVWLLGGTDVLLRGPSIPGPAGAAWSAAWATDFNADGMADVRWFDYLMTIWLMAGTGRMLSGPEIPAPPGGDWSIASTGDFNNDGLADVLWENTVTRRFAIWLMSGPYVLVAGPAIPEPQGP